MEHRVSGDLYTLVERPYRHTRQTANSLHSFPLEGFSCKIGGPNKTVEIEESMFGRDSIIGDTLSRVSGCLAVVNECPAKPFLFPYRTDPPTH